MRKRRKPKITDLDKEVGLLLEIQSENFDQQCWYCFKVEGLWDVARDSARSRPKLGERYFLKKSRRDKELIVEWLSSILFARFVILLGV